MTRTSVANGYPADWQQVSRAIRHRADDRCECEGECGLHRTHPGPRRCTERNGEKARWAVGAVVLTVAHLNHKPSDCRPENLRAMCQRCHLRYDSQHHIESRRARRRHEMDESQMRLEIDGR
jgi:hypothetical protein